jgi:hypothetical protein
MRTINFQLGQPVPEAKCTSQYTLEMIETQLKRDDLSEDQREYLEKLKERKYGVQQ